MTEASSDVNWPSWAGHHKSRKRVKDQGEVFTQPKEVQAMLDLIPAAFLEIGARFFEPAAGDGNFLVAILKRKISSITPERSLCSQEDWEFALLRCLSSIYAVDIDEENVREARYRMLELTTASTWQPNVGFSDDFLAAAITLIETNIVRGDTLNSAQEIMFIEYTPIEGHQFDREVFFLERPELDLFYSPPPPLERIHYTALGRQGLKIL
jgi:hypothetical protein